ncbi:MAG TPA: ATP-binding protein [Gemmatimonadaceae bacterium]
MTKVIEVPLSLDDTSFEQVFEALAPLSPDEKILIDARRTRWASSYGLTALLTVAQTRLQKPALAIPDLEDTASYWTRAHFFRYAEDLYEISGRVPRARGTDDLSVLLEVTPITKTEDVHQVVDRIQTKAQSMLTGTLHLDPSATMRFTMALSEVCQNVIEHAGRGGWVAVHTYQFRKRLQGRKVAVISVCDAGIGFRQSLESTHGPRATDRWDDGMALEESVMRGASRFRDPGRGQGLAGVRKFIHTWDGKLSVRSGTAQIAIVPEWADGEPLTEAMPFFPGAQVQITLPEKIVP